MYIDILVSLRPSITMYIVVTFFTTFFGDFADNLPPASKMTMYPYTAGRVQDPFPLAASGAVGPIIGRASGAVRLGSHGSRRSLINGRRAEPDQGGTAEHGRGRFSGAGSPELGPVGLGLLLIMAGGSRSGSTAGAGAGPGAWAGADTPFHLLGR